MASTLTYNVPIGTTAYVVLTSNGQAWNTSGTPAYEAPIVGNWASYAIAATRVTSLPLVTVALPATLPAGFVNALLFYQSGGSPVAGDSPAGGTDLYCAGSGVVLTPSTYAGADTSGTGTLLTRIPGVVQPQTGDAYARIGAAGAGLSAIGDARIAHLDADVSSRLATSGYTAPPSDYQQRGIAVTFPANPPANYGFGFPIAASPAPSPTAITITVPSDTAVASWVGRSLIHLPTSCEALIVGTPTLVVDQLAIVLGSGWPTPTAGEMCYPKP